MRNRNYNDDWYNLGYLLGTIWGENYNERGINKILDEEKRYLEDAESAMKGEETKGEHAGRAFNAMVNDSQNGYITDWQNANKSLDYMTGKGGEYQNLNMQTPKGYTDYLKETPLITGLTPNNSFRAEDFQKSFFERARAAGRPQHQIEEAWNRILPEVQTMDENAKKNRSLETVKQLIGDDGYFDLNNENNLVLLDNLTKDNPTLGALALKMGQTPDMKDEREYIKTKRGLELEGMKNDNLIKQEYVKGVRSGVYSPTARGGVRSSSSGSSGSGRKSGKIPIETPQYKYYKDLYEKLSKIAPEELTPEQKENLEYAKYVMDAAERGSGIELPHPRYKADLGYDPNNSSDIYSAVADMVYADNGWSDSQKLQYLQQTFPDNTMLEQAVRDSDAFDSDVIDRAFGRNTENVQQYVPEEVDMSGAIRDARSELQAAGIPINPFTGRPLAQNKEQQQVLRDVMSKYNITDYVDW